MNKTKFNEKTIALNTALPYTLPVLTGFLFLGIAYGILMNSKGYGLGWIILMSTIVYAGSAQYVAITFLTSAFNPVYALAMTLMVNARHLFYGISLLDKYKNTGKLKPYLIFGLADETFSIACSSNISKNIDKRWFYFFVTLLNHIYWILGSVIGGVIGNNIVFNTKGLDFVLTALFTTIFIGQWKSQKNHKPALIGVVCSVISLILFGKTTFIIPAMISILLMLLFKKTDIEDETKRVGECAN